MHVLKRRAIITYNYTEESSVHVTGMEQEKKTADIEAAKQGG